MEGFVKWKTNSKSPGISDCNFFTFGYKEALPFNQFSLNISSLVNFDLGTNGLRTQSSYSVGLIAGIQVDKVDQILKYIRNDF